MFLHTEPHWTLSISKSKMGEVFIAKLSPFCYDGTTHTAHANRGQPVHFIGIGASSWASPCPFSVPLAIIR